MINITLRSLALFTVSLILASCEKEIKVKVPDYKPVLVVNSNTGTEDTISLSVSRSVGILKYKSGQDLSVVDAKVTLYKGNAPAGEMKYDVNRGKYVSNIIAEEGQHYAVKISAPGYTDVEAATNTPSYVQIDKVQHIPMARVNSDGNQEDEIRITFKDPAALGDYYILRLLNEGNPNNNYNYGACVNTVDASVESISNDELDQNTCYSSNGIFFKDALFNGTTKELRLFVNPGFFFGFNGDSTVTVKANIVLQHVTEDYFKFQKMYQYATENGDNPFSEPTSIYTNVKNGYGLFSIMSYDTAEVK